VDADGPVSLPGLGELVRSYRTPEFNGLVFHEVKAKSVLNKVPGRSSMPFGWTVNPYRGCSHSCVYCLGPDTPILLANGRTKSISDLRVGDEIYGTVRSGNDRRYVRTQVLAHWSTVKPGYRVTLEDGTELIASGDHRFLSEQGWKYVTGRMSGDGQRPCLTTNNKLMGTGAFAPAPEETTEYRRGYLCGMIRGDADLASCADARPDRTGSMMCRFRLALADLEALDRAERYLAGFGVGTTRFAFSPESANRGPVAAIRTSRQADLTAINALIEWPIVRGEDWMKGFLAGIFDAEGSCSQGIPRIGNTDPEIIDAMVLCLKELGFAQAIEDSGRANGMRVVRLTGGLVARQRFFHLTDPAIIRKRSIDGVAIETSARLGVASIEPMGLSLPMFDITTGTGDFIANGVVSHNCFARNTHTYLDFDAGHDFDSQVIVKVNAPEILAGQLRSARWQREHVAMGTNTDPYQRAEGRYELMPGIIRALAGSGTPFSILTKGTLLSRDLPLLAAAAKEVSVGIGVSIALIDRELQRTLEPGTPSPQARLELVRRIREAGLPCGVFVAPILPGLTDSVDQLDRLLAAIADAGATGVTVLPLHLRPGTREWFASWLGREHPDLVPTYRELYGTGSYVDRRYRQLLGNRVGPLLRRHGLAAKPGTAARTVPDPRREDEIAEHQRAEVRALWPSGSLPHGKRDGLVDEEQLTLL
jgi:DNA repair photolyase